jgi:hypothetical protein
MSPPSTYSIFATTQILRFTDVQKGFGFLPASSIKWEHTYKPLAFTIVARQGKPFQKVPWSACGKQQGTLQPVGGVEDEKKLLIYARLTHSAVRAFSAAGTWS